MNDESKQYEELADSMDETREALRALVAGLVAEGFSDEQARWMVVGMYTMHLKIKTEGES